MDFIAEISNFDSRDPKVAINVIIIEIGRAI